MKFIKKEGLTVPAWAEERLHTVIQSKGDHGKQRRIDDFCWGMYNGRFDRTDYLYLTQVDNNIYPAEVRDIAGKFIMSKIRYLEAKEIRRRFIPNISVEDEASKEEKLMSRVTETLDLIDLRMDEVFNGIAAQEKMVQDKLQQYELMVQQEPENEGAAEAIKKLKNQLPMLRLQSQNVIGALRQEKINISTKRNRLKNLKNYSPAEMVEQIMEKIAMQEIDNGNILNEKLKGLRETVITGRPMYFVEFDTETNKTKLTNITAKTVFYPVAYMRDWIQELQFCGYEERKDFAQILEENEEIKGDERETLTTKYDSDNHPMISLPANGAMFDEGYNNDMESYVSTSNTALVQNIYIRVARDVYYTESPSKGTVAHINYFEPGVTHINKKKAKVNKRVWYDVHHFRLVGHEMVIYKGIMDNVYRDPDDPSIPWLPIVGKTNNSISERPRSLLYDVKDLRAYYNIIQYKEELLVALSGVKGIIMDKAQKPAKMSTKQWLFERKKGTMFIETVKNGRRVSGFNQFQEFDDSLSDSVQYLDIIKVGIKNLISEILGITDPAVGQFVSDDPVKSLQMSNEQTTLISEVVFYGNDIVFAKAMELFINLKATFELNEGDIITFLNSDGEEEYYVVPSIIGQERRYVTTVNRNQRDQIALGEMKRLIETAYATGREPIQNVVSLFKANSVVELEHRIIEYADKALEQQEASLQAADERKQQIEEAKIQLQGDLEKEIEAIKSDLERQKINIDQYRLGLEEQKNKWEADFKERELAITSRLNAAKLIGENSTEGQYIDEEKRANKANEYIEMIRLQTNAVLQSAELAVNKESNEKAHIEKMASIKKSGGNAPRNKQNIKD